MGLWLPENDRLGGHDPYSASKAVAELAIATARAGNVIGGDWAADRIVPDAMRALAAGEPIALRNPAATRPWQHVLEPLDGYLLLAERLHADARHATAFNTVAWYRAVQEGASPLACCLADLEAYGGCRVVCTSAAQPQVANAAPIEPCSASCSHPATAR